MPPAGELLRVDATEHDVGIGDGRVRAAAVVARRAGFRTGAFRPHGDAPQGVERGDGAAAGADFDHLDDRDAQRDTAALQEAVDARHLEAARGLRGAVVDQADFGGGAAHVVGQHGVQAQLARDVAGEDGAARGAGFDQAHGEADGGFERRDAAAGQHEIEGAAQPGAGQLRLQAAQVTAHQRLHVGVGAGRRNALVLAHFGRYFAGQGDFQVGQGGQQDVARPFLVGGVHVAVQKADGDAAHGFRAQAGDQGFNVGLGQGNKHLAARVEALAHRQAQASRHQRRGQVDVEVVLLVAVLVAHLDDVAEALGGNQRRRRALLFDQQIGGQRGAVDDRGDGLRLYAGALKHLAHAPQHAAFGRFGGGQRFGGVEGAAAFQRHVGERAADVDADPAFIL